jgi:hypothetical protein
MAVPQGFQNAKLQIEGGDTIQCAFNPETYTISKTNVWTYKPNQSKDWPDPEFGGGMPMTYKLSLLLDSSLQGADQSIKDQANALMKAMHGGGSAPKFVTFSWGSNKLPKAAPLSISIQYALFHPNGDPMRAFVDLELAQAEDTSPAEAQNPTTRGTAGLRSPSSTATLLIHESTRRHRGALPGQHIATRGAPATEHPIDPRGYT